MFLQESRFTVRDTTNRGNQTTGTRLTIKQGTEKVTFSNFTVKFQFDQIDSMQFPGSKRLMMLYTVYYRLKALTPDTLSATRQLMKHTENVIRDSEKLTRCKMIKFEIGKCSIHSLRQDQGISCVKQCGWDKQGINRRWSKRKNQGYNSMTVLAAVNDEALPNGVAKSKTQEYALWLEKQLIGHYMFVAKDERLGNQSLHSGRYEKHGAAGYVIYIAMKLVPSDDPAFQSTPQLCIT